MKVTVGTNRNSVAMVDMAEGMSKAGTVASSYRVSVEDLSAMIGTMEAVTKSGGSEVGNAVKAILINLQNVTSDKMVKTLDAANASMTEFVDGTEKLRNPIDILRDLAKTFNQLDEDDPLRAEILTNVGQKYHAAKLGALLQNMDMFDKMLVDYSEGSGSALEEADKSANNLTGRLNALQNSWDELVNSITSKSAIKSGVGFLDGLLQSATKLIDTVNVLPVALAGITAFMTAKNKDMGLHIFNDEGNFDLSGNFMGIIDVDQIKHYSQAKKAIADWNQMVKDGVSDIKLFNDETVKNNASLRNYLSTCNDGSASLKGYKQSLQAAGEATTSLRLGTILLNSVISLGLGLCIQGVISGLDYLIHIEEKEAEALEEAKSKFTESTNKIKSLNNELSSTQDRIAELQKLADSGTISVADENELKLLKETNKELERKIALEQKGQIDDAKDYLKKAQKVNKEKPYSYAHYNADGEYVTVRKHGDASEQLQDTIKQYRDAVKHYGKDKVNVENYNDMISEQAENVGSLIEAYQSLEDAGVELTKEQQAEYDSALKAQDAYLLYSYNLNKTKEGFCALNEEQKRSILNDRLLEQGLTEQEAKVVLKYIPEKDLDGYYDYDFDFPLPDRNDYKTAEEYGKAYAEAWKNGMEAAGQGVDSIVNKGSQMLEELKKSYESASEDITSLTTAMSESVSGTGLSSDSVDAVTSMFSDLKGYDEDKLLDKTANGLRLNTRELEKLKKEYDDNTAKEFYNDVEDAYNAWQTALMNGEEQSVIDSLHDQYQQAAQLADQYVGLASAYNQWQNALSTADEGDMYDTIQGKIKEMDELWKSGKTNNGKFRAFADLISYKDLSGASQAEVEKAYSNSIGKIKRYFTEGEKGLENFLKDVHKANSEWAYMQKDGTWKFDFGVGGDKDVAEALGIDVEALQIILRKMSEYDESINIDFDFDSVAMMGKEADKAYRKLKKLGKIGKNIKFKFDTGDIGRVNTQIKDAEDVLNEFRDKDGNVDVNIKGAKEAQVILSKLMTEKQEIEKPAILKVDTSQLSGKAAGVVSMLQRIQQEINTYDVQVKVGADTTETEKKIKEDIKAVKADYGEELANVHISLDSIESAKKELTSLLPEDIEVIANAIVNHKEVDDYKKEKEKKKIEVETELNDTAVNEFMNKTLEKTIKAKVEVDDSGVKEKDKKTKNKDTKAKKVGIEKSKEAKSSKADGTFNSLKGTLAAGGFANASGNINIPKNQTALVNELGEELIVRDGKWFTVKGGAQFTELKKGDIVFNHLQTRQLLKNGKITSSDNRGRFAHSRGTFGNAFSNGLINFDKYKDGTPKTNSTKKSSKSKKSSKKSSKNKKKDSSQVIDWIERKLDVLQDKIDLTKAKLENLFSFKRQKNNLSKQVRETTRLLNAQEKAASKYKKKADSIKLSDSLKKNVREGKINGSLSELIKKYGEKTADQISRYQDYIDKVKDAKQAVEELKTAIIELSRQKLELKLEDNEKKRAYQEAKYANAKTTDEKNKILKSKSKTYTSDDTAYKNYYIRAKKIRNKEGKEAKSAVSKVKGLSKKDKNQIKKLIRKGKEIPHALLEKVKKYNKSAYRQLVEYNYSVDFVSEALLEKKTANEENKTNRRENKMEQHQNRADAAEAKYNVKQQREENAASAREKNKHEAASLKYLKIQYDHLIKIAKLEGDTTEQKRLQLEKQEKIAESYQKMYDNIKTEYENQTGLNDAQIATVQSQIATLEAAGKSATKEIYEGMMKVSADTKEKLLKERAELEEAGKKFDYGSEEWYAWQEDLLAIDQQMESCTQSTIEFQKAINELDLKKFSLIAGQIESANNHISFLADMLSHKDLISKDALGITDEGLTTVSLWMDEMENNNKAIKNAQDAMAEYKRQMEEGITGDSFEEQNQKLQEWDETVRDAKLANEDLKDSIVNLVEDAFKILKDALDDLIAKRRDALQSEKDLYDYQQKITKQTKNIALIEKQIAALTGDKSEEARARLQKLNANLEEAKQDLKDTEYDKWLSDQEHMLDDLADEMEDFFENVMQDTNAIIGAVEKAVNENGAVIVSTLENLGLGDSHSFDTKDNGDGTYTQKYTDYNGNKMEVTYDRYNNVIDVSTPHDTSSDASDDPMADRGGMHSEAFMSYPKEKIAGETAKKEALEEALGEGMETVRTVRQIEASLKKCTPLKNQSTEFINKHTFGKYGNELNQYLAEKYGRVYTSWADMKGLADILGIKVSGEKLTSREAKKIRDALKDAGFAEGGIVSEINKAVKENGDDGIATLKKGEAVITPEQTEALQEVSERYTKLEPKVTPEQKAYLMKSLGIAPTLKDVWQDMEQASRAVEVSNCYNKSANVSIGDVHVHIDGSNVTDPDSFCDAFCKSNKMQRAVQAATIDQIASPYSNKLAVYNI